MPQFNLSYPRQGQILVAEEDEVTSDSVLVSGRIPAKILSLFLAKSLKIKPKETISFMKKKIGERVEKGEIIAEKKGGLLGRGKIDVKSPKDGILLTLDGDSGEVTLGILNYDFELVSPGKGKITGIDGEKINIDFEGNELGLENSFGTVSFGDLIVLSKLNEEVNYAKMDYSFKDKIILGGDFGKLAVVKACAVGASGVLGINFLFDYQSEKETLLRPLDLEGNAGFSIGKINEESYMLLEKHCNEAVIISPGDKKICLLKP